MSECVSVCVHVSVCVCMSLPNSGAKRYLDKLTKSVSPRISILGEGEMAAAPAPNRPGNGLEGSLLQQESGTRGRKFGGDSDNPQTDDQTYF